MNFHLSLGSTGINIYKLQIHKKQRAKAFQIGIICFFLVVVNEVILIIIKKNGEYSFSTYIAIKHSFFKNWIGLV